MKSRAFFIRIAPVAAAALTAGAALAQGSPGSSASLYGVVDACLVSHQSAKGAKLQLNGGGCFYGSRFGFRGTEDLGGGLRAYFQLEGGFAADNGSPGQGGRLFGRKSLVGLSGDFGSVEAGRDYAPAFYLVSPVDPMQLGIGSATATVWSGSPGAASGRTDNALNYISPTIGGFSARVHLAPGEQAAPLASRGGDTKGLGVMYRNERLVAGVAYANVRNAAATQADRATTVGAKYDFGTFSLAGIAQVGAWEGTRTAAAASNASSLFSRDYRSYVLGGTVKLGADSLSATYKRYDDRTAANFDATILSAVYIHPLSKRTQLYAGVSRLKNARGSSYGAADGNGAYAGTAPGGSSRIVDFGITHFF
jgi:general bacterial porin, GBP family